MEEYIRKILSAAGIEYTYDGVLYNTEKFNVLPVTRNSDFDVGSIVNAGKPVRVILQGDLKRDINRLANYVHEKELISRDKVEALVFKNSSFVPDFVKEVYDDKDLMVEGETLDILLVHKCQRPTPFHWTRFYHRIDGLFLHRPVTHKAFHMHGTTGSVLMKAIDVVGEDTPILTAARTRESHYNRLGFKIIGETNFYEYALKDPTFDGNYKCAKTIPLYWLKRS